jgi:hypothetical protein
MMLKIAGGAAALTLVLGVAGATAQTTPQQRTAPRSLMRKAGQ